LGRWRRGQSGNPNGRPPASRRQRLQMPPPSGSEVARSVVAAAMTPAELIKVASRAYGPGWQTALALDLGISRATVNRWARTRFRISDDLALEIGSLCVTRAQQNLAVAKKGYRQIVRQLIRLQNLRNHSYGVGTVSGGKERSSRS